MTKIIIFDFKLLSKFAFKDLEFSFRIFIGLVGFSLVLGAIAAPLLQSLLGFPNGESLYSFYSSACHQYPGRSFWIFDRPFALCARCTSGYLGVALASFFIYSKFSYPRRFLLGLAGIFLSIVDPFLQLIIGYESFNFLRFLTGLLGGISFFFLINIFSNKPIR